MSLRLLRRVLVLELACLCFTLFLPNATAHAASLLSGWVYIDRFNDGDLAFADEPQPDFVIPNVEVKLFQLIGAQEVEVATALTNGEGYYSFNNLNAGTYSLRQTQPVEYIDGIDTLGSLRGLVGPTLPGSASPGTMSNNAFASIVLPNNVAGEFYNFGELGFMPGYISKRLLLASAPALPTVDRPTIPEPASFVLLAFSVGTSLVGRRRASVR